MSALQLPLCLRLRDDAIFDNFFIGPNAQVVTLLQSFIAGASEQFVYCYGESGSGRTHLLQAACHAAEKNKTIFYLPLSNYTEFSPEIFESLEDQSCVCIDDVDAIMGNRAWEEALFYFYNRARDNNASILMSAQITPQQLSCLLPDLKSRLSSALVLEIHNLSDAEKTQALQMRAALRGLVLTEEVAQYLTHHYSRNMRDLFAVFERLDQASFIAKRRITIPFIKSVI